MSNTKVHMYCEYFSFRSLRTFEFGFLGGRGLVVVVTAVARIVGASRFGFDRGIGACSRVWRTGYHFVDIQPVGEFIRPFPDGNSRRWIVEEYAPVASPNNAPAQYNEFNVMKRHFLCDKSFSLNNDHKLFHGVSSIGKKFVLSGV